MTTTVTVQASGHDVTVTGMSSEGEQIFSNIVKRGTTETFHAHSDCSLGIAEIEASSAQPSGDDAA